MTRNPWLWLCLALLAGTACKSKPDPASVPEPPPDPVPEANTETDPVAELPEGALPPPPLPPPATPQAETPRPAENPTARAQSKPPPPPTEKPKAKAEPSSSAKAATPKPDPAPAPVAKPEPAPTKPAPTPAKRTMLPKTAHVRYAVDPAMQRLLDKDSRMEGWLRRVTPVIDGCYRGIAEKPRGIVQVNVTMHENRRPTVAIKSLPNSLAGLVPCATTKLMGQRSPLFTGPEGERHTVGIHFTP